MKYALKTLVRKLRELAQRDEKQFGGPTVESEIIRQAATMLAKTQRQPAPAEVFVYHEYNDEEAYSEQIIKVFDNPESGLKFLRERVEKAYEMTLEELKTWELLSPDDTVKDDYVSIKNDGGDISFFILEQLVVQP